MLIIAAMLICCSLPRYADLTQSVCGENLTRPEPRGKSESGGSRADLLLPWYTSGFK